MGVVRFNRNRRSIQLHWGDELVLGDRELVRGVRELDGAVVVKKMFDWELL